MGIDIPETLADVTAEWIRSALAEGGRFGSGVGDVSIEAMPESKGLIGDLATVHLGDVAQGSPDTLVLKLPARNPGSRQIGSMLDAYQRESAFYEHVAAASDHSAFAACFYNGRDIERDRWALLVEFVDADEFDFFAGATEQQASAAIDALAALHASWWNGATEFAWMPGFDRSGVGGLQPHWIQSLPAFVERYGHVLPGETAAWVLEFAPRLAAWSAAAAEEPLTLVHADYRIDNLLFRGDAVTIVDWQTAMRAPAAMDVSCFIATSLTVDERRGREAALIDGYLSGLAAHGVDVDPTWFMRSYDETLLWWMGQFGNNLAHLDPADDSMRAALTAMVERVYTAGHDRNVGSLLLGA